MEIRDLDLDRKHFVLAGAAVAAMVFAAGHYFGGLAAAATLVVACLGIAIGMSLRGSSNQVPPELSDGQQNALSALVPSAIVEALELPVLILNSDMRVVTFNRQVSDFFPHIAPGKSLQLISRQPELLSAVHDAGVQLTPRTITIFDRVPIGRRLVATVSPLGAEPQQQPGSENNSRPLILIQFRDVTEQDRLAQMRSDFIANASHELRTPLASLKGFIETLRGSARDDPKAREKFLSIMEAQASRMARILDDLLSLSRIEMRTHLMPEGIVDVSTILTAVEQGLQPVADDAKIALRYEPGKEPFFVRGDRDELEQVFQNLVHNAIKYGNDGGHIDIGIERRTSSRNRSDRIAVTVSDDGPGIAEEHLPRLTERFYRVDTATSRERGGTGLGLAIVKHILNRHRGDLEITSAVGKGSTFTVLLKAMPESIANTNIP